MFFVCSNKFTRKRLSYHSRISAYQIRQFATIDPVTEEMITTVAEADRSIL